MTKSVFRRFVFFSLAVALVCIIVVCGIITFPVSEFIESSKKSTLEENTRSISHLVSEVVYDDLYSLTPHEKRIFAASLATYSSSQRAITAICDTEGYVVYSSENELTGTVLNIPDTLKSKLSHSSYFEHGTLHNTYNKQYYISALKITSQKDGRVIGYCIVAQATLWTADYIPTIFGILVLLVVVAAILIFILSAVYAYNTTLPLKQMAAAAKRFSVGDFASRGHIKSNDEIGELSQAFNEMADSLASSEGMRRNFIANVSHELKTPMTTIAGYIDGILDGTIPKEEQEHYLGIVSQEVKRLSRLVTSMISLSKIDSGEIDVNKAPFEIQETAFNVLLGFENEIEKKELSIEGMDSDEDIITFGDKDLIHQVLYNLVENAIKFTNQGGYIRFGFSRKAGSTYVCIENSGEGVLPEDLKLIFDKFYKADKSRSINKKSMGLGLYIVRTIIRLHGGDITAESEPGEYCRFIFWIPDEAKIKKELPYYIKENKNEQ